MPQRKLNPPPWENNPTKWNNSTETQKRYGYEQWMLARVRRGLNLDHPFPGADPEEDPGVDEVDSPIEGESNPSQGSPSPQPSGSRGTGRQESNVPPKVARPDLQTSDVHGAADRGQESTMSQANAATGESGNASSNRESRNMSLPGSAETGMGSTEPPSAESSTSNQSENTGTAFYSKVHRIYTFGFNDNIIADTATLQSKEIKVLRMPYPLCGIPWERVSFYMTPAEFHVLPNSSRITECGIRIRLKNIRQGFETNSSETNMAALHQINTVMTSYGLNHVADGCDHKITGLDNATLSRSNISVWKKSDMTSIITEMYGIADTEDAPSLQIPRTLVRSPFVLNKYFAFFRQLGHPNYGWPDMTKYIKFLDGASCQGKIIFEATYKPSMGYVKPPHRSHLFSMFKDTSQYSGTRPDKTLNNIILPTNSIDKETGRIHIKSSLDDSTYCENLFISEAMIDKSKMDNAEQNFEYNSLIEKCQMLTDAYKSKPIINQPSVHIGIQPAPTIPMTQITGGVRKVSDMQAEFEIEAFCKIVYRLPVFYMQAATPHEHYSNGCLYKKENTPEVHNNCIFGFNRMM